MKRVTFGWSFFVTVCLVMVMCVPAWGRTIKIGVIGPMNFVQGKGHWNGAIMAAEEINAKGGVQVGKEKMKIELVKADSNEFINVTDATNAMERLMTQDKVDFVVGGFRTEAVLPMQDIAMDYKKIFIGCGAATEILCDSGGRELQPLQILLPGHSLQIQLSGHEPVLPIWAYGGAVMKNELNVPVKVRHCGREGRLGGGHGQGGRSHDPQDGLGAGRDVAAFRQWPRMSPRSFRPFRRAGPI